MNDRRGKSPRTPARANTLRSRAVGSLRAEPPEAPMPAAADLARLVHELQVHQEELRMQNEELRRTQAELEASRELYADLYDFAPVGYLALDEAGNVRAANLTAVSLLGVDRAGLLRARFDQFVPAKSRDAFDRYRQQVIATHVKQRCTLVLRRFRGGTFVGDLESVFVDGKAGGGRQCLITLSDASVRARADEEEKESRSRFAALVASAMDGLITADEHQRIILFNAAAERMFGYAANDIIGQPLTRLIPDRFHFEHVRYLERVAQTGVTSRSTGALQATVGRRSDGTEFPMEASISPIEAGGKKLFTVIIRDVSERKRAEDQLKESEARLAAIVSSAMDGIITTDRDHRIVLFNAAAEAMFGCHAGQVLGQTVDLLIPERFRAAYREDVSRFGAGVARRMMGTRDSMHGLRADGSEFPIETSISRVDLGGQTFFTVILRDITVRLRETQEHARLAAIVESSEEVILSRTLDGTIISWNRSAERLYGYTAAEAVGQSIFALIVPPDRTAEPVQISQKLRCGELVEPFETIQRRKDGSLVSVSITVSPVKNSAGDVIGVSAIVRDITRQKEMERALRSSEEALADFFAESPLGLIWAGPDGRVERVNRAQLELLGRNADEVMNESVAGWFVKPDLAAQILHRLARRETVSDLRVRLRRKDGSLVHVLIDANSLWRDGAYVHSRWFVRDITRRLELQREVLAIAARERQRLGHDLHDDLCQHLSGIQFLSETLAGLLDSVSKSGAERAREIGRLIRHSIDHARELAHGLSPVSLEDDGLMVALQGLAESTRKIFRRDCRFSCEQPVIIRDQTVSANLYHIAQEAVSNAIQHGRARRIELSLSTPAGQTVLAIRDNGVGLPVSARKRTGMGLRVMQYRAGAIGAVLEIKCSSGGGTDVVCTIGQGA